MIPKTSERVKVLWAPSATLPGHTSYKTFYDNCSAIMEMFERNGWKLYVKFHPGQVDSQVECFRDLYTTSKNIEFVDKKESIFDWMPKMDMVITDKSLTAFDAITERKPIMIICGEHHYELMKRHSEGMHIFTSFEKLESELSKLQNDRNFFTKWSEDTIKRQDAYFLSLIDDQDVIERMAEALRKECKGLN